MRGYNELEELKSLCRATLSRLMSENFVTDDEYVEYRHKITNVRDIYDLEDIKNELEKKFRKSVDEALETKPAEPSYDMPTPEKIEEERRIMMANPNYAKFEDVEPPTEVSITTVVLPTEEVLNDSAAEKLAEDFFLDPDNAQHLTELRNNYLDGKIDKEVYDNLVSAYFNEWTYRNENNVLSEGEGPKLH